MSSDGAAPNAPHGSEKDQGEPVSMLADQEELTSPDFIPRLRRRIHRRAASSQVVSFCWELPQVVLLEMANLLGEVVAAVGGKKEV